MVSLARASYPHIQFECVDCILEKQQLARIGAGAQLVFCDIGGTRPVETLVVLLPLLQSLIGPAVIVVKSRFFAQAAKKSGRLQADGSFTDFAGWWSELCALSKQALNEGGKRLNAVRHGTDSPSSAVMHPLQYPRVYLQHRAEDAKAHPFAEELQICRYHNYLSCHFGEACKYDHEHCHSCGKAGHQARECASYCTELGPNATPALMHAAGSDAAVVVEKLKGHTSHRALVEVENSAAAVATAAPIACGDG